jgi:dihydrofolate reductase
MRRIVAFDRVSADGYFATPDGKLDWTVPEQALDQGVAGSLDGSGTMLFGRRTYEMFESFWPHVAATDSDSAPDPHTAGRSSPAIRAMARWINASHKIVFSTTRKEVPWNNSRLLHEIDPREIESMKQQPGTNIMLFGSGSVVSQLTEHGLIDEYHFVVGPVLLGAGKSLINGVSKKLSLNLLEATKYPSGNVVLRYERR